MSLAGLTRTLAEQLYDRPIRSLRLDYVEVDDDHADICATVLVEPTCDDVTITLVTGGLEREGVV